MARTKASVGSKVSSGKSSKARCSVAPPSNSAAASGSGERGSKSSSGGNPVCPRETPKWQKPITNFFIGKDVNQKSDEEDNSSAGSSKQKPKKNVIHSDDEEILVEKPLNRELDETIELEPLNGEDSHKIEEYYQGNKGKGLGKKTKGKDTREIETDEKENIKDSEMNGIEKHRDTKRDRDEDSAVESVSKKIKVN